MEGEERVYDKGRGQGANGKGQTARAKAEFDQPEIRGHGKGQGARGEGRAANGKGEEAVGQGNLKGAKAKMPRRGKRGGAREWGKGQGTRYKGEKFLGGCCGLTGYL